jgi:hypothetical protein
MAKQNINIGVNPNDGTGDVVREAFRKSKENFDELYARPTGDMNKSTYDSDNSGAVDQADKITGVDAAGNVTYYGKDAAGNIGFHSFSEDKVAVYDAGVAGFEGVLYIDIANFKLYLWDDVNEVYVNPVDYTSDSSITIDNVARTITANVSTYSQEFTYAASQSFTLDFEPTNFLGVYVQGVKLHSTQYTYTAPNTLTINDTLESGDVIETIFERFIIQP